MERRRALRVLGALASLPALEALRRSEDLAELGAQVRASLHATPRAMSAEQYAIVGAAAEQIIPRTDTPGATDVRVADFIDTMLADWYDAADRDRFLTGVDALSALGFTTAGAAQQLALLTTLDDEVTALRRTDDRAAGEHWFAMLKFLTVWGYYTSQPAIEQELRESFMPGYYKGDVPYAARGEVSGGR